MSINIVDDLLARYDAWRDLRERLSRLEAEGSVPKADEWHWWSDAAAVDLLHQAITALRATIDEVAAEDDDPELHTYRVHYELPTTYMAVIEAESESAARQMWIDGAFDGSGVTINEIGDMTGEAGLLSVERIS